MIQITITKNDDGTFTAAYFVAGQGEQQSQTFADVPTLTAGLPEILALELAAEQKQAGE
jgi:hypothetical protein